MTSASRSALSESCSGRKSAADPFCRTRAMPPVWPIAAGLTPREGDSAVYPARFAVSRFGKGDFTAAGQTTRRVPMSDHALPLRLVPDEAYSEASRGAALIESSRRLADVFHHVLAEQSLDALLDRIADALAELIPHDSLTIYEADEPRRMLTPVLARDKWADKILADRCPFGIGLTGWGVEHREPVRVQQAHLDPRVATVRGTPADEPEALITIPLIARDSIKGALNVYRLGEEASFDDDDFKRVNDVYGHGSGDEILRSLADSLKSLVRSSDVVCRLGGEEFAIVMVS